MSTLELRGISKRFSATVALNKVNLTLRAGEVLALVGENGAGKSTLMKILSGVQAPDEGSISLDGEQVQLRDPWDARRRGISIIHQEFSLVPHLDVTDNLFLGRERTNAVGARSKHAMKREAAAVLERLRVDFPIDSMVGRLGVAQQQFVEIAKALLTEPRVLIMDEPTATLTMEESQRLLAIIRDLARQGVAVIFISHHLDEVFEIADTIVCLRDGESVGERKNGELSRDELIRMMVGRDWKVTLTDTSPRGHEPTPAREILLDVRSVRRKPGLPENSFQLHSGEILGIAGLVGAGRTKMVRAIIGADRADHHDVTLRGKRLRIHSPADARRAGIGLVPEDRKGQGLVLAASVRENLLLASWSKYCHPLLRYVRHRRIAGAVPVLDPLRHRVARLRSNSTVLAFLGFVLLCLAMTFLSDRFATWSNLENVARQVSINAIIAAGMTVVILSGGIDLSVGSVMALSMTLSSWAMLQDMPIGVAVLLGLATGLVFGAFNGVVIAYGRLPAIIVTLATMEIPRGLALLQTGGYPQSGLPATFSWIGQGEVLGIQTPTVIMLLVFALLFCVLRFFPMGRYFYAIGGNEEAVRLSGVRVERYQVLAYTICGLTASIAGMVLSSRLMSGQPNAGIGFELDAIAAVVLGGTAITCGRGSIIGTLIGAMTLGVLSNGLSLMNVSPYTQKVLKGVIILLAIYAGTSKRDR